MDLRLSFGMSIARDSTIILARINKFKWRVTLSSITFSVRKWETHIWLIEYTHWCGWGSIACALWHVVGNRDGKINIHWQCCSSGVGLINFWLATSSVIHEAKGYIVLSRCGLGLARRVLARTVRRRDTHDAFHSLMHTYNYTPVADVGLRGII